MYNYTLSLIAGLIAMVAVTSSYMFKKRSFYLLFQSITIVFLILSYLFIEQYFSMIGLFIAVQLPCIHHHQLVCTDSAPPKKEQTQVKYRTVYCAGGVQGADDGYFLRRSNEKATASGGLRDQSLKNPLLLPPDGTIEGAYPKQKSARRNQL